MPVEIRRSGKAITYHTVAERISMIHEDYPHNVSIETEIVDFTFESNGTPGHAVVKATVTVYTENGERRFTGYGKEIQELKVKTDVNYTAWLEKGETRAIGRALAASGRFGGEYPSADELAQDLKKGGHVDDAHAEPMKPRKISTAQIQSIAELLPKIGMNGDDFREEFGDPKRLTFDGAGLVIATLKDRPPVEATQGEPDHESAE